LFAVHPLRVEAVAWISERKGTLSIFLGMLTLWAYAAYVRDKSIWQYGALLVAFCASLMAKPSLVTLPFLLLVLDWWPLRRLSWRTVAEKLPLLGIVVVVSLISYRAQDTAGAVVVLPWSYRLANAVTRYFIYVRQTVYPVGLAIYYPLPSYSYSPEPHPTAMLVTGALVLLGLTAAAFVQRRRMPYLLVGWLWYLGTLVPVIGIVQISSQAYADRYTYFPQIGLLIAACWLLGERPKLLQVVSVGLAAVLIAMTLRQLATWKDSESVWRQAARNTPGSPLLLASLLQLNLLDDAAAILEPAVRRHQERGDAFTQLAEVYLRRGRISESVELARQGVELSPETPGTWCQLGLALASKGELGEAETMLDKAVLLDPKMATAYAGLGGIRGRQGRWREAADCFRKAAELDPAQEASRRALRYAESKR
jgi:hypothetical protein